MGLTGIFAQCRKGTVSVEAALVLPILISILLGMVEISNYIELSRKAMSAAQTVADLVAQEPSHTDATLAQIRDAAALILNPFPVDANSLSVTIASIGFDDSGDVDPLWQDPYDGSIVGDPNDAVGLGDPTESVIMVTLSYVYDSPFNFLFTDKRTLNETAFARPRIARRTALNDKTDHDI